MPSLECHFVIRHVYCFQVSESRSLKNCQHCLSEFKFRAIMTIYECHFVNRHESCTMSGESRSKKAEAVKNKQVKLKV